VTGHRPVERALHVIGLFTVLDIHNDLQSLLDALALTRHRVVPQELA
jgi:hypothetical protein